jgi:hypothetical protein
MGETIKPWQRLMTKAQRVRAYVFGEDDPSQDLEMFLRDGHIEQLVQEGRTPFIVGSMGELGGDQIVQMLPYWQVPPKGYSEEDIDHNYISNGMVIFVNKLGIQRKGSTYRVTEEQSEQIKARIRSENDRLGRT